MFKSAAVLATAAVAIALAVPGRPLPPTGSWQVDARHSDAQLSADGTTDFGKTRMEFTIGYARVSGTVNLDGANSANSRFDFRIYPAGTMAPPIDEDGKVKAEWFTSHAYNTLVCFHSKGAQTMGDGKLKTTGNLVLTRVDRNVILTADEAYSGPVYGPAMVHRLYREATFVFDIPAGSGSGGSVLATGSTRIVREDFPQLLRSVLSTYWPPVVEDKKCETPSGVSEAYSGAQCTGTFLMSPPLPEAPTNAGGADYPGPAAFNSVVGDKLNIHVRMRLTPGGSGAAASD